MASRRGAIGAALTVLGGGMQKYSEGSRREELETRLAAARDARERSLAEYQSTQRMAEIKETGAQARKTQAERPEKPAGAKDFTSQVDSALTYFQANPAFGNLEPDQQTKLLTRAGARIEEELRGGKDRFAALSATTSELLPELPAGTEDATEEKGTLSKLFKAAGENATANKRLWTETLPSAWEGEISWGEAASQFTKEFKRQIGLGEDEAEEMPAKAPKAAPPVAAPQNHDALLEQARTAITDRGAPRAAVIKRLQEMGVPASRIEKEL